MNGDIQNYRSIQLGWIAVIVKKFKALYGAFYKVGLVPEGIVAEFSHRNFPITRKWIEFLNF